MRRRFVSYLHDDKEHAGANISWSSIFAGVVTFIGIFITLSFIGSAIGFGKLEPTSSNPFDGVGTGLIIWTVLTFILSFICAGFVAGVASQRLGVVHGFLTWATTALVLVLLVSYTTVSVLSGIGNMIGGVATTAGKGVKSVAGGTSEIVSSGVESITENINVDTEELDTNVKKVLRDTDVKELQPEYIQGEVNASIEEIKEAAKNIATNPENAGQIIDETASSLEERAKTIGENVDRDAIAEAVSKNTDLSKQEAEEATDNIYEGLQKASKEAETKINEASVALKEAKVKTEQTIQDARVAAEDASNATAKASVWAFIAMLLGMILTSVFGLIGSRIGSDPRVKRQA